MTHPWLLSLSLSLRSIPGALPVVAEGLPEARLSAAGSWQERSGKGRGRS